MNVFCEECEFARKAGHPGMVGCVMWEHVRGGCKRPNHMPYTYDNFKGITDFDCTERIPIKFEDIWDSGINSVAEGWVYLALRPDYVNPDISGRAPMIAESLMTNCIIIVPCDGHCQYWTPRGGFPTPNRK